METTKSVLIPDADVEQDIRDTEAEISDLERKLANIEAMPYPTRLDDMRRGTYRSGIEERRVFIGKLRTLLAERAENKGRD